MMDDSIVESILQNEHQKIKRKFKRIQYRKPKGKLIKSGGILNRSVYKLNASKSFNESGRSHVVSIQNINSFLSKNKDLAKALENSRKQAKTLEKEKFSYQLECLEMKKKLNNLQNAVLKCTCNHNDGPTNKKVELLLNIKENITNNMSFIESYIDQITRSSSHQNNPKQKVLAAVETSDASVQANLSPQNIPSSKQPKKQTRNKKLQVDLSSKTNTSNRSLEKSTEVRTPKRTVSVQTALPVCNSTAVQCSMTSSRSYQMETSGKKKERTPLKVLNANGENTLASLTKSKSTISRVNNKKSPFKIYKDESNKENLVALSNQSINALQLAKSKRSVTICAEPTKVHYYEVLSPHYDRRLRPRNANQSYKEPSLNTKLQQDIQQLKVKKKKRRKRKATHNPTMTIQDIISLVEESFIAGQCSTR